MRDLLINIVPLILGFTPLLLAIKKEKEEIIDKLLDLGADIMATIEGNSGLKGYNSLAIVAKYGQLNTGQVIMKHLRSSPGSWWLRREHINHVNEHNELAYVST